LQRALSLLELADCYDVPAMLKFSTDVLKELMDVATVAYVATIASLHSVDELLDLTVSKEYFLCSLVSITLFDF